MPWRAHALINLAPNYLPPVRVLTSPTVWTLPLVVLCQQPPTGKAGVTYRGRQRLCVSKPFPLCATTMLVLLMCSLPIKSATINYCSYEGELTSNLSFDGLQRHWESRCVASVAPWVCSSGVLAANWLSSETREHMTVVTWGRLHGSSWITGQVSHGWWSWLHFKSLNTVKSTCLG